MAQALPKRRCQSQIDIERAIEVRDALSRKLRGKNTKTESKTKNTKNMKTKNSKNSKNTTDDLIWGFGIEHEAHIVHVPLFETTSATSAIDGVILYNTFEVLTDIIVNHFDELNEDYRKYAKKLWSIYETSGRFCAGHWVLKGTQTKMPEFVTTKPISTPGDRRYLLDYVAELIHQEQELIFFLNEVHPKTNGQMKKYGPISNYFAGMSNFIKVPKSSIANNYIFEKKEDSTDKVYTDYMGSYHLTITLPHTQDISLNDFIDIHRNFANQLQWLEPLLIPLFFSADDNIGKPKTIKGSYRVMRVGWGNFAGSDVRRFGEGIGRYSNIPNEWRKNLEFDGIDKLKWCENTVHTEPGAVSSLSSDFRTFGAVDKKRPWHRESGAGMTVGNGIEIRIFDNFDVFQLYSLTVLIAVVAENSRVHKFNQYVYQDPDWILALQTIMRDGWLASISPAFVDKLRAALGLEIDNGKTRYEDLLCAQGDPGIRAIDLMLNIYCELLRKRGDGEWARLMIGEDADYHNYPLTHGVAKFNRDSWEMGFMYKANRSPKIMKQYNALVHEILNLQREKITVQEYIELYNSIFSDWPDCAINILYFIESLKIVNIRGTTVRIIESNYVPVKNFNAQICNLIENSCGLKKITKKSDIQYSLNQKNNPTKVTGELKRGY